MIIIPKFRERYQPLCITSLFKNSERGINQPLCITSLRLGKYSLPSDLWLSVNIALNHFTADQEKNTSCAPQILILFIDMVLMSETKPANEGCKESYMFSCQRILQMCLVFIALLCVPILLLGTPIYKMRQTKKKKKQALVRFIFIPLIFY